MTLHKLGALEASIVVLSCGYSIGTRIESKALSEHMRLKHANPAYSRHTKYTVSGATHHAPPNLLAALLQLLPPKLHP